MIKWNDCKQRCPLACAGKIPGFLFSFGNKFFNILSINWILSVRVNKVKITNKNQNYTEWTELFVSIIPINNPY